MPKVDRTPQKGGNGVLAIPSAAEKIPSVERADPSRQGYVRCTECGQAFPPEPMQDGRCFFCRKGIRLNK